MRCTKKKEKWQKQCKIKKKLKKGEKNQKNNIYEKITHIDNNIVFQGRQMLDWVQLLLTYCGRFLIFQMVKK